MDWIDLKFFLFHEYSALPVYWVKKKKKKKTMSIEWLSASAISILFKIFVKFYAY